MSKTLKILLAQINPTVGAIKKNAEKIISIIKENSSDYDVILFPELALCGYPPGDLLFQKKFHQNIAQSLEEIQNITTDCYVILGHPHRETSKSQDIFFKDLSDEQNIFKKAIQYQNSNSDVIPNDINANIDSNSDLSHLSDLSHFQNKKCFNATSIFYKRECLQRYYKQHLPNYGVFDEQRYFIAGSSNTCILSIKGYRFGVFICEDIWYPKVMDSLIKAKVDGLFCLNASPFDYNKQAIREAMLKNYAKKGLAIFYVNQIGGQDDLVFDGQSMVYDSKGKLCARAAAFREDLLSVNFNEKKIQGQITTTPEHNQLIYDALLCGLKDYVEKNGFPGLLLGLSGGIDSALNLALAVDAIGASRVHVLKMPSQFTAAISLEDAEKQLQTLRVSSSTLSIDPSLESLLNTLNFDTNLHHPSVVEENIQARIRGLLLMAYSNKTGSMVLVTSNKSEVAVGYSTLYGDMAGGYAPLKDILKTQVYELARYRNTISQIIPERVITRPPSAELAPNQTDQDNLPNYEILDVIIKAYMSGNKNAQEITAMGYAESTVKKVLGLIKRNEYKRFQSAPGPKISPITFGRDWRYPLTNGFEN